jgi:hypothetical protein
MEKYQVSRRLSKLLSTIKNSTLWTRIFFVVLGVTSTVWFLIRVIPKPSRATYPCIKAATPVMSGFVIYLLAIIGSAVAFKKFRKNLASAKYLAAGSFLVAALAMITIANTSTRKELKASDLVSENYFVANEPIGTASGLKPGRVVWVWNEDATDENLIPANKKTSWWANYTNKEVVDLMLRKAITGYTDIQSIPAAWDALFKYYNQNHEKGSKGYTAGEKIYIKINVTNSCCSVSGTMKNGDFHRMDNTPEVLLALLKQLIEEVGVDQSDIYLGDPFRIFHDLYWDMLHGAYPDVVYCDGKGANGRHQTVPSDDHEMFFSDGEKQYRIPQEYIDSEYLINVPCLKTHDSGGITLGAKNHQGSILQDGASPDNQSAFDMHYALPDHDDTDGGHYRYRHLVDYLGHEQLGGKTLVTIIDGIWAGRSWEGFVEKWNSAPFNGDYPSSLFISQDRVAIDAVCYDFLLEEYKNKSNKEKYAYMEGTDDYLYQAADPSNWADGVEYDPEGDGKAIGSLGVYEHWNSAADKKYSRNLGTGNGIELIAYNKADVVSSPSLASLTNKIEAKIYPNPAKDDVFIEYNLIETCRVSAEVFTISGKRVIELFSKNEQKGTFNYPWNVSNLQPGTYVLKINARSTKNESITSTLFNVN